jgi:hypothetical protein
VLVAKPGHSAGAPPSSSGTSSTSSTSSAPVAQTARYTSPGGIAVVGPVGWTADDSAGNPNVRDYVAPNGTRKNGVAFRIGIGDIHKIATIQDDVAGARSFLDTTQSLTDVHIMPTKYVTFLGSQAADIEYTAVNDVGVSIHVIERVWLRFGTPLELILYTKSTLWLQYRPVFDQLTSSATLTS